jgi:lycopene cyclase domain-containing protein
VQHYLYLILDISVFIIPFAFSFYPKANFSKKWKYVLPAILITAVLFIVWDEIFMWMRVWSFNPDYLTGIQVYNLPIEEVLFFFCIPYACFFTYFALTHLIERDYFFPHHELISSAIITLMLVIGIYNIDRLYTSVTFILTGLFLAYQMLKLRPRYMGRFYFAFLFLLIPFFLINGILTGSFIDEPVVFYNDNENLGFRIGTIPVEDIFYGMLMMLMSVTIAEEMELRRVYHTLRLFLKS